MTEGKSKSIAFKESQIVDVTGGKIQGVYDNGVTIFKGIPFDTPPVGDLRWKAPQPAKPWTGVIKTDTFQP